MYFVFVSKQAAMLLDELTQHVSERYFSHYINPNLLAAIYAATGRKMAPIDSTVYNDGEHNDENAKKIGNGDYRNAQPRQQQGKNHAYAEEIDDNLDYGSVDD